MTADPAERAALLRALEALARPYAETGELGNNIAVEVRRLNIDIENFPIALVERGIGDDTVWISLHTDLADAAEYHLGQESADEWRAEYALDLRDATVWNPTNRRVTFDWTRGGP